MSSGVQRSTVAVEGRDQVRAVMLSSYNAVRDLGPGAGDDDSLTFSADAATSALIAADRFRMGGTGRADANPMAFAADGPPGEGLAEDALAFCVVRSGRLDFSAGRLGSPRFEAGDVYAYPQAAFGVRWSDVEAEMVRLPLGATRIEIEQLTGTPAARVRFLSMAPASPTLGRLWAATSRVVVTQLLRAGGPADHPLVRRQLARTVLTAALAAFPNTAADEHLGPGPGGVDARGYWRAVAWIEEHAGEPITAGDVAAAVGTSARDLVEVFRVMRGQTMGTFVRLVRLDRAREDLLATGAGTAAPGIADVAARWGFADPDAFARRYEREFGHRPEVDLMA